MSGFPMPLPNETDFWDVNDKPISVKAIWNLKAAALALSMVGAWSSPLLVSMAYRNSGGSASRNL